MIDRRATRPRRVYVHDGGSAQKPQRHTGMTWRMLLSFCLIYRRWALRFSFLFFFVSGSSLSEKSRPAKSRASVFRKSRRCCCGRKKKTHFFLVQAGGHWWEPREESVRRSIVYLSPALSLRLLHSHRQQCHFRTVGSAELRSAKRKCLTLHRRIEQREIVACMASATNLGDEFVSAPMSRLMAITCSVTISFY